MNFWTMNFKKVWSKWKFCRDLFFLVDVLMACRYGWSHISDTVIKYLCDCTNAPLFLFFYFSNILPSIRHGFIYRYHHPSERMTEIKYDKTKEQHAGRNPCLCSLFQHGAFVGWYRGNLARGGQATERSVISKRLDHLKSARWYWKARYYWTHGL